MVAMPALYSNRLKEEDLDRQLQALVSAIEVQDLERLMIALREFKQLNVLRVAAAGILWARFPLWWSAII